MAANMTQTPLLKQYVEMKRKHPDAVLLFRVGDFYETFSEDAITASEILGITLTRRANGKADYVELAGFPHHALDTYLPKLVRAGKRVAICEQLEDPKQTKKKAKDDIKVAASVDLTPVFSLLTQFFTVMGLLSKLAGIRRRTEEIRSLARELKIPPKLAFDSYYEDISTPIQHSLFDL